MASHNVTTNVVNVGKRYVFFSELSHSDNPQLKSLGTHAQNTLSYIDRQLTGTTTKADEEKYGKPLIKIQLYLGKLKQLATIMKNNEQQFVLEQLNLIKTIQHESGKNIKQLNLIEQELHNITDQKQVQYGDLKNAVDFTYLLSDLKELNNDLNTFINNDKIILANYNKLSEDIKTKIQNTYLQSYDDYKSKYFKELLKPITETLKDGTIITRSFQQTKNTQMAEQIITILHKMAKDDNFIEKIKNLYAKDDLQENQILDNVISYIAQNILMNPNINSASNINFDSIKTELQDFFQKNAPEIFFRSTQKSIEEYAMRKENEFWDLTKYFFNIEEQQREEAMLLYFGANWANTPTGKIYTTIKSKGFQQADRQLKIDFTRQLGLTIQKNIKTRVEQATNSINLTFNAIKERINNDKELKKQIYKKRKLEQDLKTQLSVINVKHSGIAELVTSKQVAEQIVECAFNKVTGSIQLKDDVQFVVRYIPEQEEKLSKQEKLLLEKLNDATIEAFKDFLPDYKRISGGQTKVSASQTALSDMFKKIESELRGVKKKDLTKLLEKLKNNIIGSISVKDYDLYHDTFGYHGGSLGGGKKIDSAIENITQMYEAGGISKIDADTLIFATINCTDFTYGNENILQHIKDFLLGGAALMMFDEDLNNANNFLDTNISKLLAEHTSSVLLYHLGPVYIPASYILEIIHDNLIRVYGDVETEIAMAPKRNYVIITTHNLTPNDINYELSSIERWNDISNRAIENTKIEFMFMAGMLDIVEAFSKAFQVSP